MAYVYLIKSRNNYKIGYTSNLGFRFAQYITCNPNAQMIQYVRVQKKTKHQLESIIHNEIKDMGYKFLTVRNPFTKKTVVTEWIKSDTEISLSMFKATKNRKIVNID